MTAEAQKNVVDMPVVRPKMMRPPSAGMAASQKVVPLEKTPFQRFVEADMQRARHRMEQRRGDVQFLMILAAWAVVLSIAIGISTRSSNQANDKREIFPEKEVVLDPGLTAPSKESDQITVNIPAIPEMQSTEPPVVIEKEDAGPGIIELLEEQEKKAKKTPPKAQKVDKSGTKDLLSIINKY